VSECSWVPDPNAHSRACGLQGQGKACCIRLDRFMHCFVCTDLVDVITFEHELPEGGSRAEPGTMTGGNALKLFETTEASPITMPHLPSLKPSPVPETVASVQDLSIMSITTSSVTAARRRQTGPATRPIRLAPRPVPSHSRTWMHRESWRLCSANKGGNSG
jgi:hypothetical protein